MSDGNIYMRMPIEQVRQDVIAGVALARQAWRQREPEQARAMGLGIEPEQARRKLKIIAAVGDFLDGRPKRDKAEFAQKEAKFADKQRTMFGKQEYK